MSDEPQFTIGDLLQMATEALRWRGNLGGRLDAEVLLAHLLRMSRAHLLARSAEVVPAEVKDQFVGLVARRANSEPVAYLTGRRQWLDFDVDVTPAVLVPRPETEGLFDLALRWARGHNVQHIVDVGTGSGILAIALARALPASNVVAIDVSAEALAVAEHNRQQVIDGRDITFARGDLLDPIKHRVDLIVANLPYIGVDEFEGLPADVRDYEPREALVGGHNGSELIEELLGQAVDRITGEGAIFLEVGPPQASDAYRKAQDIFPMADVRVSQDYAGLDRYVSVELAQSNRPQVK